MCPFYYQQYWKAGLHVSNCDYGKVDGYYCSFSKNEANHFGYRCNLAHPNSFPRSAFLCHSPLYHSLHSPTFSASPIWHNQQLLLFTPFQVGTIPRSTDSAEDSFHVLELALGNDKQATWKIIHRPLQAACLSRTVSMMGTEKLLNVLPTRRQLAHDYHSSYSTDGKDEALENYLYKNCMTEV